MTSVDLLALIQQKFAPPHFLTFPELRDGTGFDSSHSADCVALGMYRSRGREIYGFEIKVSRGDWLNELKRPDKAEAIAQYCDWWYLVVPEASIVKAGELPAPWGLMVPSGRGLKVITKPQRLEAKPPSRLLLCSFVKAALKSVQQPQQAEIEKLKAQAHEAGYKEAKQYGGDWEKRYQDLRDRLTAFEQTSGVRINEYTDTTRIGEAVRVVLHQKDLRNQFEDDLRWKLQSLDRMRTSITHELEACRAQHEEGLPTT